MYRAVQLPHPGYASYPPESPSTPSVSTLRPQTPDSPGSDGVFIEQPPKKTWGDLFRSAPPTNTKPDEDKAVVDPLFPTPPMLEKVDAEPRSSTWYYPPRPMPLPMLRPDKDIAVVNGLSPQPTPPIPMRAPDSPRGVSPPVPMIVPDSPRGISPPIPMGAPADSPKSLSPPPFASLGSRPKKDKAAANRLSPRPTPPIPEKVNTDFFYVPSDKQAPTKVETQVHSPSPRLRTPSPSPSSVSSSVPSPLSPVSEKTESLSDSKDHLPLDDYPRSEIYELPTPAETTRMRRRRSRNPPTNTQLPGFSTPADRIPDRFTRISTPVIQTPGNPIAPLTGIRVQAPQYNANYPGAVPVPPQPMSPYMGYGPPPPPLPHSYGHKVNPRFYFVDGTCIIQVGDTLYRIHKHVLNASPVLAAEYGDWQRNQWGWGGDNFSLTKRCEPREFDLLLSIFYPNDFTRHEPQTVAEWTCVLKLASELQMKHIRVLAVNQLSSITSAAERIELANKYGIKDWLVPAFMELCARTEELTLEEGKKMGIEAVIGVTQLRSQLLANVKSLVEKL